MKTKQTLLCMISLEDTVSRPVTIFLLKEVKVTSLTLFAAEKTVTQSGRVTFPESQWYMEESGCSSWGKESQGNGDTWGTVTVLPPAPAGWQQSECVWTGPCWDLKSRASVSGV